MRTPEDCRNMDELRQEIDTIDDELVAILARRATYIDRAAQIKKREGLAANIPVRVEQVVANVRALGEKHDLSPELAETIWRELIRWSIAREEVHLKQNED